jgi:hypothetical protein
MPSPYLTKSDVKACYECRTKLYYLKREYPTNHDENEYLQFLADGGFMIETVAKAQYPHGVDLAAERDPQRSFRRTLELIAASPDAVVFEAAVVWEKFCARIDILRREGSTLHLIEVKSSSIDAEEEEDDASSPFLRRNGAIRKKWHKYLIDVAFQLRILSKAFPEFEVKPWLCVVNKGHRATPNETMAHFSVVRDEENPRSRPEVVYSGDFQELQGTGLIVFRDVSAETGKLMQEVEARADQLAALLDANGVVARVQEDVADLYKTCRTCEYRFSGSQIPQSNGFAECWGPMASAQPHLLDLHRVGQTGSASFEDPVPPLLRQGRASLLDLGEEQLGAEGVWMQRRHIQWSHSRNGGSEHLPKALTDELLAHQSNPGWPMHFLDFEACNVVLPHHAGLRPYERVAFQWSCHKLDRQGNLTHAEWLNTGRDLPNFAFARNLRECIGESGTVYVWSPYEQSTLQNILTQIDEWTRLDERETMRISGMQGLDELNALAKWIDGLLGAEDANGKRHCSRRIRDLHKLALAYYFHPEMRGRTSMKAILPAVWHHSAVLRAHPWFARYLRLDSQGQPLDPYKTLPPLPLGEADDDEDAVTGGTGAIRVYQDLIFARNNSPELRANREQLLKQYCELDTAAMAMIWTHWTA